MKPNSLSMDRHHKAHLYDISTAIDEVYSFFEQVPKRFDEYQKNLMLRRAIERNIGIIINDLPKLKEEVTALLADNS